MRTVGLGRGLLALASASLAIRSFAYGQFAWQAFPAWIPWQEIWVYGSASVGGQRKINGRSSSSPCCWLPRRGSSHSPLEVVTGGFD
jgi:hypothetical protein